VTALDPFAAPVASEAELRAIYPPPTGLAARKQISTLDAACRELIACCPLLFVATAAADGTLDVTPRGGPPGFVTVLDDGLLAIPDATGNRRIDSLRNIVENGRAGLLFVIPGRGQTLRVNGRACVSTGTDLLARLTPVGKRPPTALVVAPEEVFTHCPKAFVRSHAWDPETWLGRDQQPSPAAMLLAHVGDPELTLEDVERDQADSLRARLA
jgi:PPOX class probable FMN-dependent enzyme